MDLNKSIKEIFTFDNEEEKILFEAEQLSLDIIAEITNLMNEKNMNKSDLARELGVSKGYLTQLFSGSKLLNLKTIIKFQRIFNVKFSFNVIKKQREKRFVKFKPNYNIVSKNTFGRVA